MLKINEQSLQVLKDSIKIVETSLRWMSVNKFSYDLYGPRLFYHSDINNNTISLMLEGRVENALNYMKKQQIAERRTTYIISKLEAYKFDDKRSLHLRILASRNKKRRRGIG